MKSLPICVFVWLIAAFAAVDAAPARMLHQPAGAPTIPPAQPSLAGTTWQGMCFNIPCWITLKADGTLTYRTSKDDNSTSPGVWSLTGNQLVFEINQYSTHRGIVADNFVTGDSSNKDGLRGTFRLQRVPGP
jgi:hypothetical protein